LFFSSLEKKKRFIAGYLLQWYPVRLRMLIARCVFSPSSFPRKHLFLFCLQGEGKPPRLCGCLLYLNKGALATLLLETVFDLAFETLGNSDIFVFKTYDPPFLGVIASSTSPSRKNPHNARVTFLKEVGTLSYLGYPGYKSNMGD